LSTPSWEKEGGSRQANARRRRMEEEAIMRGSEGVGRENGGSWGIKNERNGREMREGGGG